MSAERHVPTGEGERGSATGGPCGRACASRAASVVAAVVLILVPVKGSVLLAEPLAARGIQTGGSASSVVSAPGPATRDTVPVDPGAFLDSTALAVFTAARGRQMVTDSAIASYEAIRRQRLSVELRTPLRDRTVYHAEAASRVWWSPDGVVEQFLASSETTPDGTEPPGQLVRIDEIFDPSASPYSESEEDHDEDARQEGSSDDEPDVSVSVQVEDFLAPGAEEKYRYRTADTLTLGLPDGRTIRSIGLEVIPRERSGRLGSGMIWIEPESGAVVRAVSRLSTAFDFEDEGIFDDVPEMRWVPGVFRPIQFDVSLVVVEYSLWDFRHWMRRRVRMEGAVRAGVVTLPGVLEETYQVLDVTEAAPEEALTSPAEATARVREVAERWREEERYGEFRIVASPGGRGEEGGDPDSGEGAAGESEEESLLRFVLAPVDSTRLHDPEWLPPPVWEAAPRFASEAALEEFGDVLRRLQIPPARSRGIRFAWGHERPGLLRYNRVEGLSMGTRAEWTPPFSVGPLEVVATGRMGVGTWVPDGRLDLVWTGPHRRLSLGAYHAVAPVDPGARSLGLGNSASALVLGRDVGDYFRTTGASLIFEPGPGQRPWYRVFLSAEEHRPLPVASDFSVFGKSDPFRPALEAERLRELMLGLGLAPWWGSDPRGVQGGVDFLLQGGTGDRSWIRGGATGRLALPLFAGLRAGVEAAGGHVWGRPPLQRSWFLGGTRTLRGYGGGAAVGRTYGRGRVDLSVGTSAGRLSLFGDAGWAGERRSFEGDEILVSTGVGLSVLEGLVRLDLARAVRAPTGWRLELHLDSFH